MLSFLKFHFDFLKLRMDCDCACADNKPLADASRESAQIMADLGDRQLSETRRQYDKNMAVAQPVIDAQLDIMDQTKQQGEEQYNYQKDTFRPVEQSLVDEAEAAGSEQMQETAAGKAIADARAGNTAATNMIARQGNRYGMSPAAFAAKAGVMSASQASTEASTANSAREREKATGFAKKLDIAGLGRGLTGASQGAYSLSINAGNSATSNQNATSAQLLNGTAQSASITGQGQQMKLSGLSSYANAEQAKYTAMSNADGGGFSSMLGGLGGLGQGLGAMKTAGFFAMSSKKLKTNKRGMSKRDATEAIQDNPEDAGFKKRVSAEVITKGLQSVPVEAWKYKEGVADEGEHIGPYAEDMQKAFGDQAAPGGKAIDLITISGLHHAAIADSADRLDRIEKKIGMRRVS